jgi:hypothetical protein
MGFALVADSTCRHRYLDGASTTAGGTINLNLGQASGVLFDQNYFTPRTWLGCLATLPGPAGPTPEPTAVPTPEPTAVPTPHPTYKPHRKPSGGCETVTKTKTTTVSTKAIHTCSLSPNHSPLSTYHLLTCPRSLILSSTLLPLLSFSLSCSLLLSIPVSDFFNLLQYSISFML